ncbi:phosphotransferase family protein [Microlunatus soli]|uniref:Phosphotransferase enzyme family protein n=1 Tax=Microlunatus soli TaxID=630515 RepID=A0A1H1PJ19_9ACTN|nr:phosphotransferase [Microlunatus soli]SDS10669.1 Phosphotransferase enzyme family protein [Microlunatus soli]
MIDIATRLLRRRHALDGPAVVHETWGSSIVVEIGELLIKASGDRSTTAEALVAGRARAAGVPAPDVIDSGVDARLPGGRWMIMKRMPGTSWDAGSADDDQITSVIDQVGNLLIKLRAVRLPGWGWIDDTGHGTSDSWSQWLRRQVTDSATTLVDRLPPDFVRDAYEAIDRAAPELAAGSLLNGDLGLSHVLVDSSGRTVTGLLDWAAAIIGDPLYDVATFSMGGPAGDPIQQVPQPRLIAEYAARTGNPVDDRRVDLYRMINHLFNACWSVDNDVLSWTDDLCRTVVALLTKINS